jgi:hypothetical protein
MRAAGHGKLLRRILMLFAIGPIVACIMRPTTVPFTTRWLAAALWVLCLVPAFIYLRQPAHQRRPIPFFPTLSFIFGLYYVLPLTLGVVDNYYNAPVYPDVDYDYPVQLAFLGWTAMIAGYLIAGILSPRKKPRQIAWNPSQVARIGFTLMFGTMAFSAIRSMLFPGGLFGSVLQFVLALQWLGAGLLIVLARRGELSKFGKQILIAGLCVVTGALLSGGNIAPMAMFFAVCAFALWIARPYFKPRWIVAAFLAAVIAISFRGIVIDFRRAMSAAPAQLARGDNLKLMVSLLGDRVAQQGLGGAIGHGLTMTAGRSAIMDLFANVARRTPSEVPYWKGETYKSLIGAFVPRILWPEKPIKDLGQGFGHRYALIHESNRSTAINLPIMVEFFVNFGGAGVVLGMLIVGMIYRVLDNIVNRPGQPILLSMIGVVILLPLLLIESDFSLVMGGLPLTGAAFYAVYWQLKRMTRVRGRATAVISRTPSSFAHPRLPAG